VLARGRHVAGAPRDDNFHPGRVGRHRLVWNSQRFAFPVSPVMPLPEVKSPRARAIDMPLPRPGLSAGESGTIITVAERTRKWT
jgi:hypothetical protein